jgi:signal transduction histidine kinase
MGMLRYWKALPAGILGFAVLLSVGLWLAVFHEVEHDGETTRRSVETQVSNLARAFEEHVLRTSAAVDQALLHLRAELDHEPMALEKEAKLLRQSLPRQFIIQIGRIDRSGKLAFSDLGMPTEPSDLSDREHFRFHREHSEDVLFISRPVLGRVSGQWSIQFTRRIYDSEGWFAGVMVISVSPDYFTGFYRSIDVGSQGTITLLGQDGVIRARAARTPSPREPVGYRLTDRPFLDPSKPDEGVFEVATALDGITRIIAYRRLAGLPLIVLVSVGRDEANASSLERRDTMFLSAAIITAVMLGAALVIARLLARHDDIQDAAAHQALQLQRSNAELEAFAYAISHDLREPLRTVNSFLSLLVKRAGPKLDASETEFVNFARDGAVRMDRLIVSLLEYSRVGRRERPFEPVALTEVVGMVVANLRSIIEASRASVTIAPPLPQVLGDGDELLRLFQNLVGNALKYRPADRDPVVVIAAEPRGGEWVISVTDNGIGIAAEHHERIFGIFQRLHGREEYDGCGIGLALCRKIVEHHHGRIWLTSCEGRGSTFFVALPALEKR